MVLYKPRSQYHCGSLSMKMQIKKKYGDKIFIEWRDSCTIEGWINKDRMREIPDEVICYTNAWFFTQNKDWVIVCQTKGKDINSMEFSRIIKAVDGKVIYWHLKDVGMTKECRGIKDSQFQIVGEKRFKFNKDFFEWKLPGKGEVESPLG